MTIQVVHFSRPLLVHFYTTIDISQPVDGFAFAPVIQNVYDSQTLNPYAYCRNNPLILIDPSGMSFDSFGGGFSGFSGGFSGGFGDFSSGFGGFDGGFGGFDSGFSGSSFDDFISSIPSTEQTINDFYSYYTTQYDFSANFTTGAQLADIFNATPSMWASDPVITRLSSSPSGSIFNGILDGLNNPWTQGIGGGLLTGYGQYIDNVAARFNWDQLASSVSRGFANVKTNYEGISGTFTRAAIALDFLPRAGKIVNAAHNGQIGWVDASKALIIHAGGTAAGYLGGAAGGFYGGPLGAVGGAILFRDIYSIHIENPALEILGGEI